MRIYIHNLSISEINLKNCEKYKIKTYKKNLIFTKENILENYQNNIYILEQKDFPITFYNYNKDTLIFDESYFNRKKIINYLPFNHYNINLQINEYIINPLDEIKLIIEYQQENSSYKLTNFYFLVNNYNKINSKNININHKQNIDTFLSLLRNIN